MGVSTINQFRIKIFADGADVQEIVLMDENNSIDGFTTNPTLMAQAGVEDYLGFAKALLSKVKEKSISFEVFSDDLDEMYEQAIILRNLGDNVSVKIPVTNTKGVPTYSLVEKLSNQGVKLNVTAVFTTSQIQNIYDALNPEINSIISIFSGRIANAGIDPEPIVKFAVDLCSKNEKIEILWASPREVFNLIQAERCGCHIITMTPNLIKATKDIGKNLEQYSLETVRMFYDDAVKSGFKL